jgi:N-acetylglucosamine malate deacetylase 1
MKVALAIAAHPDDIEILMAGTLMLLKQRGYQTHYLNLANGCCGTTEYDKPTIIEMRRQEAIQAAHYLGAVYHESICNDLEIFYDQPTLATVAAVIRQVEPSIILTHSLVDYMEDHTNTARLAVTAAFARGMPNFETQPEQAAISKAVTVYHAQPYFHCDVLGNKIEPQYVIDVSDLMPQKREALAKHISQKKWLDISQGQDSYLQTMTDLDAQLGQLSGLFQYAEGWRRHFHIGFCQANDDPLRDSLRDRLLIAK